MSRWGEDVSFIKANRKCFRVKASTGQGDEEWVPDASCPPSFRSGNGCPALGYTGRGEKGNKAGRAQRVGRREPPVSQEKVRPQET